MENIEIPGGLEFYAGGKEAIDLELPGGLEFNAGGKEAIDLELVDEIALKMGKSSYETLPPEIQVKLRAANNNINEVGGEGEQLERNWIDKTEVGGTMEEEKIKEKLLPEENDILEKIKDKILPEYHPKGEEEKEK